MDQRSNIDHTFLFRRLYVRVEEVRLLPNEKRKNAALALRNHFFPPQHSLIVDVTELLKVFRQVHA